MNNMKRNFQQKNQALRAMANGGGVKGPGGPTDDAVGPVMLSNEEYVLPADTVQAVGKQNLDRLKDATHEPVGSRPHPGAGLRQVGMADGGVPPFPDATGLQAKDLVPPRPLAPPYPDASGLSARDITGPGGQPLPRPAATPPTPPPQVPGEDITDSFAKRTSALRQNAPLRGTPPPSVTAAEAAPAAASDAEAAIQAAAKPGLGARALGAAKGGAAAILAPMATASAVDSFNRPTEQYARALDDHGPGVVSNTIASGVQGVNNLLAKVPGTPFQPMSDAQRDAAAEAYNGIGLRTAGVLGDFGNKILGTVGLGTGTDSVTGDNDARRPGAAAPVLPSVGQVRAAQPGVGTPAGGAGGSYTVNGVTHELSAQDVRDLGGRLPTVPSGQAPGGQGNGLSNDVTESAIRALMQGQGVAGYVPQDRSRDINTYYDNLADTAKKSFTSKEGQGNLVRHLVDIENARNNALGTDANRLTGLAESMANNRTSNLRTVADIANQQNALRQQAFQRQMELARIDRQYALDARKFGEEGASSVNDYTDRMFTGEDGKADKATGAAFRQFLNENRQTYAGGKDINDLPARDRYAALDQARTDFMLGKNRNEHVGGNLGGKTTVGQVQFGEARDPEFGDITKGAGVLPTLYGKLRSIGHLGNSANYQVTQDSLGNVTPLRDLVYDENGNISADRLSRIPGSR